LASLTANTLSRLGAGAVLVALLVGGVDALPLLVVHAGLLALLATTLFTSRGWGLAVLASTAATAPLRPERRGCHE
jgi:hypothetical protein